MTVILLVSGLCWVFVLRGGMQGIIAWYTFQILVPLLGLVFLAATCVRALIKRRFGRGFLTNLVVGAAAVAPAALLFGLFPIAYPASVESTTPSLTVRLPANEPLKVAWGGDTIVVNYHVIVPDQRWAYDLFVEPYLTGSEELEDYGCYGVSVLSPAAGQVTTAHDGEPDVTPGQLSMNLEAPFGNHVVIQVEQETYLVIAHLKKSSLTVTSGDVVEEGAPIGECGNSGNTSEPHIHIHHQRQDPALYPVNFAEGLPLFFRDHDGPPMPEGGIREVNGQTVATGVVVQHRGS